MPRRLPYAMTLTTLALAVASAGAEIIIVTSDSGGTGGPDCTLRDAITAANTDADTGGCSAGNGVDTIELPIDATITLTTVDNNTTGENGLPVIASAITINGNGATIMRSLADGTPEFRIFFVSGELILNNVTVANGEVFGGNNNGLGGGLFIHVGATALLTNITVSGNTANLGGGGVGITASNQVSLANCMISENSGGALGGGILSGTVDLLLTNTTVCGNTPDQIVGDYTDGGGNLILNFCTPCIGDLDDDDGVGAIDLGILLASWGPCPEPPEPCPADIQGTGDGIVGAGDLAVLLGAWGPCE